MKKEEETKNQTPKHTTQQEKINIGLNTTLKVWCIFIQLYQDQGKRLEQKNQDSTRIAEVQEIISEALVAQQLCCCVCIYTTCSLTLFFSSLVFTREQDGQSHVRVVVSLLFQFVSYVLCFSLLSELDAVYKCTSC